MSQTQMKLEQPLLAASFMIWALSCLLAWPPSEAQADFRFRISDDLGSLDWGYGEVNVPVVQQLMEGLTTAGKRGEPVPAIAASWRNVDQSKLVIEFKLRRNAKWSDGLPVCAQHFVDAWLRVLSPAFASPYAHYLYDIKNALSFQRGKIRDPSQVGLLAKDCHTLRVTLERPVSYFPELTSHWVLFPVRLDLIKSHGSSWTLPGKIAVTGPYILEEWLPDERLSMVRNTLYYGDAAYEKKLIAQVVKSDATALTLFQSEKLDWLKDVPFLEKPRLASAENYKLYPSFVVYHLGFRQKGEKALAKDVRCALVHSLDTRAIPKLLGGGEIPAHGIVPEPLAGFRKRSNFDTAAAAKLFKNEPADTIDVHYYAKDIHKPLMEWLQQEWKKHLGLKVKLVQLEPKSYWSALHQNPPSVFLSGTTAAYAHPFAFLSEFLSGSHANWGSFSSATYDRLSHEVSVLNSGKELWQKVASAQKILVDEECAVLPLYFRNTASMLNPKWDGFHINPLTYVYLKHVKKRSH